MKTIMLGLAVIAVLSASVPQAEAGRRHERDRQNFRRISSHHEQHRPVYHHHRRAYRDHHRRSHYGLSYRESSVAHGVHFSFGAGGHRGGHR